MILLVEYTINKLFIYHQNLSRVNNFFTTLGEGKTVKIISIPYADNTM